MIVAPIGSREASRLVIEKHYLHRRPPISHAFGCYEEGGQAIGVVTYGVPASRHLQKSACPSQPDLVLELNRLWLDDTLPRNSESWFLSRTLRALPPRIVVSYADTLFGHYGYVYRAANFRYAGWTDMDRKTPRYDYLPTDPTKHSRDAFRSGVSERRLRAPKVKYWTTTGSPTQRRSLARRCGWPELNWKTTPPPQMEDPS